MTEVRTAVPQGSGWGFDAAKEFRDRVHKALDTPATGLSPQWVVERVREIMPRDTIATCDAGASRWLGVQKCQNYGARE